MAADLSFLGGLPCRKGENGSECSDTNCLFRHTRDVNHPFQGDSEKLPAPFASPKAPDEAANRPRKRLKTDDVLDEYDPTSPPVLPPVPEAAGIESPKVPVVNSAKRAVSPPPLKRKAVESPKSKIQSPAPVKTPTGSSTPSRGTSARKPEGLNPRLVASAPASHGVRLSILERLHEQFVRFNNELKADTSANKLVLSDQELIWLALDEEEKFAIEKRAVYGNSIKNKIMHYKRMPLATWKHMRIKANGRNPTPETKEEKEPIVVTTGLTPEQEVAVLLRLRTPIHDLAKWGYVPTVPTEEEIQQARMGEEISKGFEVCDRCSTRFQVFPGRREEDGALTSGGKCTHHPGRAYFVQRQPGEVSFGGNVRRYRCCGQAVGDSSGCTTGETHVFKITDAKRLSLVWTFAETPPNPSAPTDRAVGFDCEMGYTTKGLELIRLTATAWPDGKELLDVLVRPFGEVLDLNSRYSGVYAEDIANALPFPGAAPVPAPVPAPAPTDGSRKRLPMVSSPRVARDLLFSLISPDTPLIGHGLENDLNSMRVVHPNVVDTILLYPHNKGLPMRNSLKYLMETHLNRRIQVEKEGQLAGHDSAEDARAAGDLVRLKVKHEWEIMRRGGWTLSIEGEMVAPGRGLLTEEAVEGEVASEA